MQRCSIRELPIGAQKSMVLVSHQVVLYRILLAIAGEVFICFEQPTIAMSAIKRGNRI